MYPQIKYKDQMDISNVFQTFKEYCPHFMQTVQMREKEVEKSPQL